MQKYYPLLTSSRGLALCICITFPSVIAHCDAASDCSTATKALQNALATLPTSCSTASDCQTIFLLPNSCAPGLTVGKRGLAEQLQLLEPLRVAAFQACVRENATHPVCNRPYTAPACRAKTCVTGSPNSPGASIGAPE